MKKLQQDIGIYDKDLKWKKTYIIKKTSAGWNGKKGNGPDYKREKDNVKSV